MRRKISFVFNDAADSSYSDSLFAPGSAPGLKFIIRTDAAHATSFLKSNIVNALQADPAKAAAFLMKSHSATLPQGVSKVVHQAYRAWGHGVLEAMADCLDYGRYGMTEEDVKNLNVYFYNAHRLSEEVVRKATQMVAENSEFGPCAPVIYVSLDEMIEGTEGYWSKIAFSRHFSLSGDQHFGYMARPGSQPLEEQIAALRELVDKVARQYGAAVPIVLLEDNVRHAKMLNWVIGLMDEAQLFTNGRLAGIATCFCCASESEREAIKLGERSIPVGVVVDCKDEVVDVTTTRDLLFDGIVVQANGEAARLPVLFMDLEKMFKIDAAKVDEFRERVRQIDMDFCCLLEGYLGMPLPLSWFSVSNAVSAVTGCTAETTMIEVLQRYVPDMIAPQSPPPPADAFDAVPPPPDVPDLPDFIQPPAAGMPFLPIPGLA